MAVSTNSNAIPHSSHQGLTGVSADSATHDATNNTTSSFGAKTKPSKAANSNSKTPDDELIESCIQLLKENYPKGMTIKEMAAELLSESQPDHIKAICRSSTVLSTKLNSFYRRCHPDFRTTINTKYPTCPITREACPNTPNRLMYKYVTVEDQHKQEEQKSLMQHPNRPISPPPNEDEKDQVSSVPSSKKRVTRPLSPPPGPDSPPSSSGSEKKPYSLRKVIKKTPHAFIPPSRRKSSTSTGSGVVRQRSPDLVVEKGPNPYYEGVTLAVLDSGYSKPWMEEASYEDFLHPESVSMEDLDKMLT